MTAAKTTTKRAPAKRPATAKVPQDRKPKVVEEKATKVELPDDAGFRVTYKGVSVDIGPNMLNDYEFVKAMKDNDVTDVLPKFAGDQEATIVEACRGEDGIVRMYGEGSIDEFIGKMLEALAPS